MSRVLKIALTLIMMLFVAPLAVASAGAGMTYHGRLVAPDGSPVIAANVQFRLQIRTPGNENCLMYEEIQSKDMSGSNGIFALTINDGSGARQDSSALSIDQIFSNRGTTITFPAGYCMTGTTYSANTSDGRKFQVYFNDGSFSGWEPVPSTSINFVPMAIEAMQVGGYNKDQLIKVADGVPTASTEFSLASWTELLALIGGTSSQYLKPSSAVFTAAPQWSGTPSSGNDLANKTYVDAQVAAGLPNVGTAGTYTKVTTDSKGRVTSGTVLVAADIPAIDATKITSGVIPVANGGTNSAVALTGNKVMVSSPGTPYSIVEGMAANTAKSNNTFVMRDGSGNIAAALGTFDALTVLLGGSVTLNGATSGSVGLAAPSVVTSYTMTLPASAGSSGQVLTTNGTGVLSWSNASGGLPASAGTAAAPGYAFSGNTNTGMFGAAANQIGFSTNGAERLRIDASGNIGIGTSAPGYAIDAPGKTMQLQSIRLNSSGNLMDLNVYTNGSAQKYLQIGANTSIFDVIGIQYNGLNSSTFTPVITASSGGWKAGSVSMKHCGTSANCGDLKIEAASTSNQLYLSNTGKIGIGTASPSTKLHMYDATGANTELTLESTGNAAIVNLSPMGSYGWSLQAGATSSGNTFSLIESKWGAQPYLTIEPGLPNGSQVPLYIKSNGNIGVGTSTPKSSLDLSSKSDAILPPTVAAAANSSCTSTLQGGVRYNSTINSIEMCDGAQWNALGMGGSGSNTANAFSFSNVTGQTLGTLTLSNAVPVTGFTGTLVATVTGAATAQISINGSGTWSTSGAIQSGQTVQVRLTSSGSVNTALVATVTVGTTQANWQVTTRPGALQIFTTPGGYFGSAIGGLAAADSICQGAAGAAGYAGVYKAIMSDDTTSAASRLTLSYPIVNAYDGLVVAASNLWAGSLSRAIKNPSGASSSYAWTGSTGTGGISTGNTCSSWTAGVNGILGAGSSSGSDWLNTMPYGCAFAAPLYCIQQ